MMRTEDLTQGCIYIFELIPDAPINEFINLYDAGPFLKSPDDMDVLDKIMRYDIPHVFTLLSFEGGVMFLYITAFAGKLKKGMDTEIPAILAPYARIYNQRCRIPHLGTLLFNGLFYQDNHSYVSLGYKEILRLAFENEDILVVYGQPGTGKTSLINDIVNGLIGSQEFNFSDDALLDTRLSARDYCKRLVLRNKPDYELAYKVKATKLNLEHFVFARKSVSEMLEKLLFDVSMKIGETLLKELMNCIDISSVHTQKSDIYAKRLLKAIYSLPRNIIAYEDNGDLIIKEAIIKLTKYAPNDIKNAAEELELLHGDFDGSDKWFEKISLFRKSLIIKLNKSQNVFISDFEKKRCLDVLDRIIQELMRQADKKFIETESILMEYIAEISDHSQILEDYLSFPDYSRPIMCGGFLIADMDCCVNESLIIEKLPDAKRVILLSKNENGLFKIFANAAKRRQREDNIIRAVTLDTNYRQHPVLAEFISRNFYEKYGMPKIKTMEAETDDTPRLIWFDPRFDYMSHIYTSVSKNLSIGILTMQKNEVNKVRRELREYGFNADTDRIRVGSEKDFVNLAFDIVYLLISGNVDENRLCMAMSRARTILGIIGNRNIIRNNSSLYNFYLICAGDDSYGRVYD